ncbi:MAG: HAD hydrolase family protein, partial [Crenarchaeota archaeon]|nr:HAD hydrolase family protein [Thermoproteota archaeon]
MTRFKLAAFDIDGTLTISRNTVMLDLGALKALRILEENGVHVVLVSSNMIPAVAALKKYIGLSGPAIGETGCIVYWGGNNFEILTKYSAKKIYEEVLEKYSLYVYGSWQNRFRSYDYALKIKPEHRDKAEEIVESIKDFAERHDPNIKVGFSG